MMNAQAVVAGQEGERRRDFVFRDEDFYALRDLVKATTGINLGEAKRELVYGRVSRRLRALRLESFAQYRDLLESGDEAEMVEFCNAITTNLTAFFREGHHFEYLREQVLRPRVLDPLASRRIRIWSSACSTGEEPYSIAMSVCEAVPDWRKWDIRILATDLDSRVLATAQEGLYAADRMRGLSTRQVADHFVRQGEGQVASFRVAPQLASMITFKQLNLMDPLPMPGPLDVIFCRNVIIYFDKETQRQLFVRMSRLQRPGNLLCLGHSENLFKVSDDYSLVGKTIYRRS